MKAARLYSIDDIKIEDLPVPEVGPREALMKTVASGICSGETMPWYMEKKAPLVLGHEPSGVIVEVGAEVTSFSVGNRVFVHHHAPCLGCRHCKRGDHVQCETWKRTRIVPGGISEYILIPEENLGRDTLRLPDAVGFEDATLIEPLACAVKAAKRSGIKKGDTAFVIGLGVMGMLNAIALRDLGAGKVIGSDMVPFRRQRALEIGLDAVIDASSEDTEDALSKLTGGAMAEVVIVCPGNVGAIRLGLGCASAGGTVVMFTPVGPADTITMRPDELYFRDVSLVTSYSAGPDDTAAALRMIEKGKVTAGMLVTHRFPIERTAEAYRLTAEARDSLKCLITFGS